MKYYTNRIQKNYVLYYEKGKIKTHWLISFNSNEMIYKYVSLQIRYLTNS